MNLTFRRKRHHCGGHSQVFLKYGESQWLFTAPLLLLFDMTPIKPLVEQTSTLLLMDRCRASDVRQRMWPTSRICHKRESCTKQLGEKPSK
ncbi:hypothetical protein CPSG_08994 [Coccidioides posadasii str. Silveira]|uniref:Uncharacterized protein n=1 Tax=Coccidioides posadasii (strain RMSCC 757 / Silveira) TaxID=443226 RepID=E9DGP5_COCPS|nr:hypothetical protein CPSG_08994 [Coccidioides posadasii str. Silveira]